MVNDLSIVIRWWAVLFGFGVIFLPLTFALFDRFFDRGYLFAKVIATGIIGYCVWAAASVRVLPFRESTIWLVILLAVIANSWLLTKTDKVKRWVWLSGWKTYLVEEILFFSALVSWCFIRGLQPDIQGLEKFMDFGFVNSILRSDYFPPKDMWFAGSFINYYYFGHFITALLTIVGRIASSITYNLMMATLFTYTLTLGFSLTGNLIYLSLESISTGLRKKWRLVIAGGLAAGLLMALGANLHPAYYNLKMGVFDRPYCGGAKTYWYPNATRYIGYCPEVEDKTIHEFPAYSFVVSDLHGHVSDIPFVLTFLAVVVNLIVLIREKPEISLKRLYLVGGLIPLLSAIMFMTNQWDYPIYLLVLGLGLLSVYVLPKPSWLMLGKAIALGLPWVIISIVLVLPFQLNFVQIAKGVDFVRAHSLFYQLLVLWGVPWFFGLSFIWLLVGKRVSWKPVFSREGLVKAMSKLLRVELQLQTAEKEKIATKAGLTINIVDYLVIILLAVSTLLVIVPEIIYVKDIYIASYHRANTMFKLTYQSFMLFSICVGYILIRVVSGLKQGMTKSILGVSYVVLWGALMCYPFYAIKGYYGEVKLANYKGLYGLKFLGRLYPNDLAAINWLNENIAGQPVVLEAAGDSYTDYDRVSMATGLPTVEGWLVHEWLWRGAYDEPGKRAGEVQTIYETEDVTTATNLLKQYRVKYVFVGNLERTKYPNIAEEKFANMGRIVFAKGETRIYELSIN